MHCTNLYMRFEFNQYLRQYEIYFMVYTRKIRIIDDMTMNHYYILSVSVGVKLT